MKPLLPFVAEFFEAPAAWAQERIKDAPKLDKTVDEGWFFVTEFQDPFCYMLMANRKNFEIKEQKVYGVLNEHNHVDFAILFTDDGATIYKWNGLKSSVQKLTGQRDYYKPFDKKFWYKKTGGKEKLEYGLKKIDEQNSKIENTLFQIHSLLRDIDGLHADSALDEICKLLYVKLYDEEITKPGEFYRFQRNRYSTIEECASVIRLLYKEANEYDKRVFSLRIPGYKRSRGVFDSPINLSSEALVKVVEYIQHFSFTESEVDLKGRLFQNLISPVLRGGMGQYFTPTEVVDLIVEFVKPSSKDLIIDPFAGSGHFLTSTVRYVRRSTGEKATRELDAFLFHKIHGMEISERMVRISMTDMRMHGDGHSNIRCVDALLDFANYQDLHRNSFDIVMTNPPFGSLLNSESFGKIGESFFTKSKKNIPLEVLGMERSIELLRNNGKIAIVLPESIFINSNLKYVRDWILARIKIVAMVSLPIETFSPFGANIKTSILFGLKRDTSLDLDFS
ncbi:MAG TPA: N-6 DNA methylase, partial [Puia sp.]|nr:N-6 DNA methylase [Puia sp.]